MRVRMMRRSFNRQWVASIGVGVLVCVLSVGCGSTGPKTVRVSPDQDADISDTTTSSQDLRVVTQKMAASIGSTPRVANAQEPVIIAFLKVDNRTGEYLDTQMFLEKIRTELIRYGGGKLTFLDREHTQEILRERSAKRDGEITANKLDYRYGADFFMTGEISSIDKQVQSTRSTYTRYSFRLVDAETEVIIWEDGYEVKKITETALWME